MEIKVTKTFDVYGLSSLTDNWHYFGEYDNLDDALKKARALRDDTPGYHGAKIIESHKIDDDPCPFIFNSFEV